MLSCSFVCHATYLTRFRKLEKFFENSKNITKFEHPEIRLFDHLASFQNTEIIFFLCSQSRLIQKFEKLKNRKFENSKLRKLEFFEKSTIRKFNFSIISLGSSILNLAFSRFSVFAVWKLCRRKLYAQRRASCSSWTVSTLQLPGMRMSMV